MIANNKYYFTVPTGNTEFNIPIEIKWDFLGREQDIDVFQEKAVDEIIGNPSDFEIIRFSHKEYTLNSIPNVTTINYDFYFYDSLTNVTSSTSTNWLNSYLFDSYVSSGFTVGQVFYFNKPFTKSFFKLDFYDSPVSSNQTNYITIIIPTQQGKTESAVLSAYQPQVKIKKPSYKLDFIGDKEGFFIYWLREQGFLNLNTFYMTAKFFDARRGVYIKMMNTPQSNLVNKFSFDETKYFYYKVELDITQKTYQVFDYNNNRVGNTNSIKWYEYVNP
jgi:hypothetical protein